MKKFILGFLLLVTTVASAENSCYCSVNPESKQYIGNARQRKIIGFVVNWTCDYRCTAEPVGPSENKEKTTQDIRAEYREYYMTKEEDGREGICEGMIYEPTENYQLMRTIYMYNGKTESFNPAKSKSKDLRAWAKANSCRNRLFFN